MRKIFIIGSFGVALALAACSQPAYEPQQYDDYASVNDPRPQEESFLDEHGDALLAGGAGYLAGKAASKPKTRIIERRTYVYKSRPKAYKSYRSSYSSRRYSRR